MTLYLDMLSILICVIDKQTLNNGILVKANISSLKEERYLIMKHSTHWTIGMVVLAVSTIANQEMAVAQVYDYEAEYSRLEVEITANMNVPPDGTKSLEPYLKAMALKSEHREKAIMLYGSALADSSQWAPKLKALIDQAQESGDRTADTAAWWLLRIRSKGGGYPPDQWPDIIEKLRFFGRPLLTEARKFGFRDSLILDRATCMIRFAVNDLEVCHLGLYDGREKVFAELDSEGFLVITARLKSSPKTADNPRRGLKS